MSRSMLAQPGLTAGHIGLKANDSTIMQGIALAYGVGVELPLDHGRSRRLTISD